MKPFSADLYGGSLRGDIQAGDVYLKLFSANQTTLTGSAWGLSVNASDGSIVDLAGFPATVQTSGGSLVTVNPSGRLDVTAGDASRVYYVGSPTLGSIVADETSTIEHK